MDIATPEQLAKIPKLLEQGLDQGALGIGINAGYVPGHGKKEYFALAELAAKRDVATFTHVRYASNMEPRCSGRAYTANSLATYLTRGASSCAARALLLLSAAFGRFSRGLRRPPHTFHNMWEGCA